MKKKEEQLQISLDRVKLQKHVYELCRVQKLDQIILLCF